MVLAPLAVALAVAASPARPCSAPTPAGPPVPAPIVLRTSCGGFRLETDGRVSRLPRHWFARHGGGTGRRFGADLALRRDATGRIVLLRRGRVVWRSSDVYVRDGGDVAFGPHLFAFASYRRGVFVTDLDGSERLVAPGRGLYPLDFTRSGRLIVSGGTAIRIVARDGSTRRFPIRARAGYAFDPATDTLFFVTRDGWLATTNGLRVRRVRRLSGIAGSMGFSRPGLLVFYGGHSVTLLRRNGSFVAAATWPRRAVFDSGLSVSRDGRAFAFRLAARGVGVVYVLRAGDRQARAIYEHRLGPTGCAVGANLTWNAGTVLYASSDGDLAVLDPRGRRPLSLVGFALALPRVARPERASAAWAADYR